jgi:hypothetical protein
MSQFVMIFRQGDRALSTEEQQRRGEEVRAWAQAQNGAGRKLDPRMLGDDLYRANGGTPLNGERPVIALLFLEACDLEDARTVANSHPGLRYGVNIELRPWAPPAQPKPQ